MALYGKIKAKLGGKPFCTMVVLAAGSSKRMGRDKLMMEVGGVPVLVRSLQAMQNCAAVDELIVVTRTSRLEEIAALRDQYALTKMTKVVVGGMTRAESSLAGVLAASNRATLIGVHDAARPLVTDVIITDTISAAQKEPRGRARHPGARHGQGNVRRHHYRHARPLDALRHSDAAGVSGGSHQGCAYQRHAQASGHHGRLLGGRAAAREARRDAGLRGEHQDHDAHRHRACRAHPEEARQGMMRIGHGYDVHRLVRGRRLILGGVDIPHETGLLGHSDADVLTHAVMDALLGAAAMGDIGQLFPDKDPAFAGADSLALLCEVVARLHAEGYTVGNIDCTVLAQAPKLAPHIAQMRRNLAQCMDVDVDRISIKATTEEGLGFTGAREGIAAHAVVLLEKQA